MSQSFNTKTVHFKSEQHRPDNSKVTPIYQTSAFSFKDLDDVEAFYNGEKDYLYSRVGNPNPDELAHVVSNLENAPAGVSAASGLAAILVGVLSVCQAGDHILASTDIYGGTYELFETELTSFGIELSFVDFKDLNAVEQAVRPNTKLVYTESITNPLLYVEDLAAIVAFSKQHNLKTMVDNTFATPYLITPYDQGVNLVVHSATKYLGGHSDITAGVVVGDSDLIQKARAKAIHLGPTLAPMEAWLTVRGVKTLALRMEKQVSNAEKLARALLKNPDVKTVYYPKNASPNGNGAIVSIDLNDTIDVKTFFQSLGFVKIIPTLAGVETTVSYPKTTSHRALSEEVQQSLGITTGLVRISVGIEDSDDIIQAFEHALANSRK
jgi:cystathionine beta-lyase/cystathionine gamma-synthase